MSGQSQDIIYVNFMLPFVDFSSFLFFFLFFVENIWMGTFSGHRYAPFIVGYQYMKFSPMIRSISFSERLYPLCLNFDSRISRLSSSAPKSGIFQLNRVVSSFVHCSTIRSVFWLHFFLGGFCSHTRFLSRICDHTNDVSHKALEVNCLGIFHQ